MSWKAKLYINVICGAGLALLLSNLLHWNSEHPVRYAVFCVAVLLASGMKVRLAGVTGTMSMNYVFVLVGIAEMSLPETMILGSLGILAQSLFHATKRPKPVQVIFNIASLACSVTASSQAYRLSGGTTHAVEAPLRLLLAAGVLFLANTLSIATVIAVTEGKKAWDVWRESYFWSFPNYLVGAVVAAAMSAAGRAFGWQTSLLMLPVLHVIYRSHEIYVSRLEKERLHAEELRKHAEEMAALHRRTITVLALAIEAKDETTHAHLERVETYAVEIGKELGLGHLDLEALRAAALLHDIGKLAVPEHIISKPGKLTPEEFEKMKIHPVVGAEILDQVQFPYPVAPIVRAHHEKWDGSGYPDGLVGEQIPIGARILSAVDCLDALATDRQYRRALPLAEAIGVVEREAGKSFDPRVVEILSRRCVHLERMAQTSRGAEPMKLSTDAKITRGSAPAAGFESTGSSDADAAKRDIVNLNHSVSQRAERNQLVSAMNQELDRCESPQAAFRVLKARAQAIAPYHAAVFYRKNGACLVPEWVDGKDYQLFASLEIPMGMGLSGWVAENLKSIVNGNPSVEPGYLNDPAKFSTLRSALAVPVSGGDGLIGVLAFYHQNRDAYSKEHLAHLTRIEPYLGRSLNREARLAATGTHRCA
jgi:putative nucleotidyltransferase with HDIG domain